MPEIIEVKSLIKNYKDTQAVKRINFTVQEGSFFAFLGENGAGKSTTINIIATLLKKTSGDVIVNQHYIDQDDDLIRNDIGVVFQGNMLDKYLTVRENIINRGSLYGKSNKEIYSYISGYLFGVKSLSVLIKMCVAAEIFGIGVTVIYRRKYVKKLNEKLEKNKKELNSK